MFAYVVSLALGAVAFLLVSRLLPGFEIRGGFRSAFVVTEDGVNPIRIVIDAQQFEIAVDSALDATTCPISDTRDCFYTRASISQGVFYDGFVEAMNAQTPNFLTIQ